MLALNTLHSIMQAMGSLSVEQAGARGHAVAVAHGRQERRRQQARTAALAAAAPSAAAAPLAAAARPAGIVLQHAAGQSQSSATKILHLPLSKPQERDKFSSIMQGM